MSSVIGDLLPAAAGVALSPIPIIAVILVLGSTRARTNGPSFAVGWIGGLVAVSAIVLVVSSGASDPDSTSSQSVNWFQVIIGVLLLAMAVRYWRRRPRSGADAEMPSWMASVESFTPLKCLGLGVLLSGVNPKNFVLTAASAAAVSQAGLSGGDKVLAMSVFVAIASITVVGAVIYAFVAPNASATILDTVKTFMARHNTAIMMAILIVLGLKVLGDGLGGAFS